ncbi:L-rhamnose-binding lectin CSL3-like [Vanacampus margaritifer]
MFFTKLVVVSVLVAGCCWTLHAGERSYDVACPGVNPEPKCPDGSRILVHAVDYGLVKDADCSARHQAAKVSPETGFHPLFFFWVKSICDQEQRCRLPKLDHKMFQQNWSPDNFIQISYTCEQDPEGLKKKILCEGQSETITCENGYLMILKAKYGRYDENICTTKPSIMTFCNSIPAVKLVKDRCYSDGLLTTSCTLTANTADLGNPMPCDELPKYLSVDYLCVPMPI